MIRAASIRTAQAGYGYLFAVLLVAALLHSAGFDGYWIGDDFGNIHQFQTWSDQDNLWPGLLQKMTEGNTPAGAFLRPFTQLIRGISWILAGPEYAGWFAVSWLLHLVNTWLIMSLVLKLASPSDSRTSAAAALAGLLFAVSPLVSEGVYWIAAGGDAGVTLLTLVALHAWFGRYTLAVPLLFLAALGFKESAGVLPLQLALLLFVPRDDGYAHHRYWAVGLCFLLLAVWFALRSQLFGDAWSIYRQSEPAGLLQVLRSLPEWWQGLAGSMPLLAGLYAVLLLTGVAFGLVCAVKNGRLRLFGALLLASAGMLTATFLNLGEWLPSGEGGRLLLTPMAWLALAVGAGINGVGKRARGLALGSCSLAILAGVAVLNGQYVEMRQDQKATRDFLTGFSAWVERHPGTTLLIIPEQKGRLPVFRNAQSGLVMRPVQDEPLLHRIIPTLDSELRSRHAQIENGLLTRIQELRPAHLDFDVIRTLLEPAPARWPEHYACWSWEQPVILELEAPPSKEGALAWVNNLASQVRRACSIEIPGTP